MSGPVNDDHEDALASVAAEDRTGCLGRHVQKLLSHLADRAAGGARTSGGGDLVDEHLLEEARGGIAVEHQGAITHGRLASCRSELLGLDSIRVVAEFHERLRNGFDKRRGAADIHERGASTAPRPPPAASTRRPAAGSPAIRRAASASASGQRRDRRHPGARAPRDRSHRRASAMSTGGEPAWRRPAPLGGGASPSAGRHLTRPPPA